MKEKAFSEMMEVLYELSRKINEYDAVPRKYGTEDEIYMVEAHTINLIGDNNDLTISQLATMTNKTKGALSQMVEKLIKKDIVKKTKDQLDQRKSFLSLTEKGNIIYNFHKELDEREYNQLLTLFQDFSYEDFQRYTEVSTILINGMKK